MTTDTSQDYPSFGEAEEILVWDEKMFVVRIFDIVQFNTQYMADCLRQSANKEVRTYYSLPWHGILHKISKHGELYVANRNTTAVELLQWLCIL